MTPLAAIGIGPGDRRTVEELTAAIGGVLGPELLGLYLYGSAVTGGFDAGVSDLDLLAVTRSDPEHLDLDALRAMHEGFERDRPNWRNRIEVAYVGAASLADFRVSAARLAVVSPGEPFHLRDDRLVEWAANWYLIRASGIALAGPPPGETIPAVALEEFTAAVVRYADEVRARDRTNAHPGELAYELLTLCRALVLVRTGRAASKQEAAAWVAERIPDAAPVLEAALASRMDGGASGSERDAGRATTERWIDRLHDAVHATQP